MVTFIDLTDPQANESDSNNTEIESVQINTITQTLTPLLNVFVNFDQSKNNKKV